MGRVLTRLRDIKKVARRDAQAYGALTAARILAHRILRWTCAYNVFVTIERRLDDLDPQFLSAPDDLTGRFLTPKEIYEFASDPMMGMSQEFAAGAIQRGDRCYGIFSAGAPVGYGWYSTTPTPIDDHLVVHFCDTYLYMYKGLTLDSQRGRRLHAFGIALALRQLTQEGYTGTVSYVVADNIRSVRSLFRLGYRSLGKIYSARFLGHTFIYTPPSNRHMKCSIKPK